MSKLGDLLKIIGESAETDFSKFVGADIVAADGEFLGQIPKDIYDKNSISNPYTFGSRYNKNSIFNPYSKYSGKYSSLSPFNRYSTQPPKLFLKDKAVAVLSTNRYIPTQLEIVSPTELLGWLGGKT